MWQVHWISGSTDIGAWGSGLPMGGKGVDQLFDIVVIFSHCGGCLDLGQGLGRQDCPLVVQVINLENMYQELIIRL